MTASPETIANTPAQLPVAQRAALALGTDARSTELAALAAKSVAIVTITNADGYKECHAARMALKRERVAIEGLGKTAREDATAFSKAVIAEERRLIAIIEPEETRLQALQDAVDARVEADKQAKHKAEQDRIAAIQQRLSWIRNRAIEMIGKTSGELARALAAMEALPVDAEHYAEFATEAEGARGLAIDRLRTMRDASQVADEQRATIAEQQRQLAEKQAQLDAEDKERAARMVREDAERKFANDFDDAVREDQQRTEEIARFHKFAAEDAARKFLQSWDDAIAEDANRAELARLAANIEEQDRIAKEAAAERDHLRRALESTADPRKALSLIRTEALEAMRDYHDSGNLKRIVWIADECVAAMDRLAELDKAPS